MKSYFTLAAVVAATMAVTQPTLAHTDGAYSHSSGAVTNQASWMARVDGSKRVSELSLPGTHDTMSIASGDIWQNQTMTLKEQLNSGLRVFDMRTRHIDDKFRMHHGMIAQDTYFNNVLSDIDSFLSANPTETVLFRLRSEHTPENNTLNYKEVLDGYLAANGSKRYTGASDNPTLDEIRGKFVIIQEFNGEVNGDNYGIPYGSLDKQDKYSMGTNWDLYDKWVAVKNHINKARNGSRDTIYMNYLSGAGGSFPYFVSSGHSSNGTSAPRLATGLTTPGWNSSYPDFPRTSCFIGICTISFEGTNTLTADYLSGGGFAGMVMADFPGERLIKNVINLNNFSDYAFNEFSWGQATDQNTNLCSTGTCLVEGDKFAASAPAHKSKLTVVSYNVERASAAEVQNQINWLKGKFGSQGPDVILLSETVRGNCGAGRNTAREYAQAFNAYYVNGNEDGASSGCQTGNAIISRYPMGNVGLVRFADQASGLNGVDNGRSFVVADVKVGDDIVHVYSTHTHHSFGADGDSLRKKQHAEMVYHSESKPFTRILGGDLNAVGHVFADPLGLHDISLNPFFDGDFTDAHDDLWTHERISSEAGLVDDDWSLILDFIFVKNGSVSNAGVCTTDYCQNNGVMSDHAPIWTDITFVKSGLGLSYSTLKGHGSNLCLDIFGGHAVQGANIGLWECSGSDNQQWAMDSKGRLVSKKDSNMCADVWGGNATSGADIKLYPCHDGAAQQFVFDGDVLKSKANGGVSVDANGASAGSNVSLWSNHSGANQRWSWDLSGQAAIQNKWGCDAGDNRCNKYLEFTGADAVISTAKVAWNFIPVSGKPGEYYLQNKWGCDSGDTRCDDWLSFSGSDVLLHASDKVEWKLTPVAGKANTFYIQNRWGCDSGDSRCNQYLTFSGTDAVLHATDKVEWHLVK